MKPFSLSVLILKVEAFFKRKMPGEKEIEIGIIAVRCREQCDGEQGSVFVVQIPYVGIDKYCD